MKTIFTVVLAVAFVALANVQAADEASPAYAVTKPSEVHLEYNWSDWTTNNLDANQIAEYMVIFKGAVEKVGMKVVDSNEAPTVKVSLDLTGGITFVGGGKTESHVTYDLTFLCTGSDGKQIFQKAYKGEVKGGDARVESGGMVFMRLNVKLDDVKQVIAKKLESEPINKPQEQEVPVVKSVALTSAAYAGTSAFAQSYQFKDLPVIPDGIQEHGKPGYVISGSNTVSIEGKNYTYKKNGLKHCLFDAASGEKTMEGWYKYNVSDGKSLFQPVNPKKTGSAVVTVTGGGGGMLSCSGVPVAMGRDGTGVFRFDERLCDVVLKRSESATDLSIMLLIEKQKDKTLVYAWIGDNLIQNGNVITNSRSLYLDEYGSFFAPQNAKPSANPCPLFEEIDLSPSGDTRFFVIQTHDKGELTCQYLEGAKWANPPTTESTKSNARSPNSKEQEKKD